MCSLSLSLIVYAIFPSLILYVTFLLPPSLLALLLAFFPSLIPFPVSPFPPVRGERRGGGGDRASLPSFLLPFTSPP